MNLLLLTPALLFRRELDNTFSLGQSASKDCMDIYYLQQQHFSQNNESIGYKERLNTWNKYSFSFWAVQSGQWHIRTLWKPWANECLYLTPFDSLNAFYM